ncbi:hypothetical protein O9992_23455 [Vibrio lentus]|nr:hypothetical protein [Vibrio lentus]
MPVSERSIDAIFNPTSELNQQLDKVQVTPTKTLPISGVTARDLLSAPGTT